MLLHELLVVPAYEDRRKLASVFVELSAKRLSFYHCRFSWLINFLAAAQASPQKEATATKTAKESTKTATESRAARESTALELLFCARCVDVDR